MTPCRSFGPTSVSTGLTGSRVRLLPGRRSTDALGPDVFRVLDLAPGGVRPGPVGRADPLRDDPLQAHRARVPEERLAVGARDMAGEPERIRCLAQKRRETSPALAQRLAAQILAVEGEEVERDQAGILAGPP